MSDSTVLDADTLSVRCASKSFPGTRALVDFDLAIRPGEVHALVGQNGSGKSTFIKLLAGYHEPDDGALAYFCGEPFELGNAEAAHQLGIRFVHQDLGLVPALDAVDNLALGFGYATGSVFRIRWRTQRVRAREATARLGYAIPIGVPVAHLTPSERTAVAIARALQGFDTGASLLVLDEPTATMPRAEVVRLFDTIRSVAARGVAVLYVSHHLEEIFSIADRVTVLRDGRRVATLPVADTSQTELVDLMTGGWVDTADVEAHQPATEVRLSVRGLTTERLVELDFDLHRGEVLGVAGITGSGREELCDALFGGRSRTGTVTVDGRELEPGRPERSVALGLGYVPTDRHRASLALSLSVRENLTLVDLSPFWRGGRMRGRSERAEVRGWIDRLSIHTRGSEALIDSLSGGNQQKVVLGKWLRVKPAVLLLDEPTQGVDVAAKAELHSLIETAASSGTSVLVCSSDEAELERLCDRVVVLRQGRNAATFLRPNINASRLVREGLQDAGAPLTGTECQDKPS